MSKKKNYPVISLAGDKPLTLGQEGMGFQCACSRGCELTTTRQGW